MEGRAMPEYDAMARTQKYTVIWCNGSHLVMQPTYSKIDKIVSTKSSLTNHYVKRIEEWCQFIKCHIWFYVLEKFNRKWNYQWPLDIFRMKAHEKMIIFISWIEVQSWQNRLENWIIKQWWLSSSFPFCFVWCWLRKIEVINMLGSVRW